MTKKFSLEFVFGKSTIILIAVALVVGYAVGNFYPFGRAGDDGGSTSQGLISGPETGATTTTTTQTASTGSQQLGKDTATAGYGPEDIRKWASEIGLDTNQFNDCFDSQKYLDQIRSDYQDGVDLQVTGTPAFFIGTEEDGLVIVSGAQPFAVFKNVIDSYLNGTAPPAQVTLRANPIDNTTSIIGSKDAQILIVEFSDFQCPFCRVFYTEILPQIESEYIDTGQAVLIYKEFPLTSIHPGAVHYGLAAKCAQEQGKWREMHDKMFDEQNKLGSNTIPYRA
jgi:protein-disulfide isomerase